MLVRLAVVFFIFFILCFVCSRAIAEPYGKFEVQVLVDKNGGNPILVSVGGMGIFESKTQGSVGLESTFFATKGWAAGFVGPTYTFDWFSVGLFAGGQTGTNNSGIVPHFATTLSASIDWFQFASSLEFDTITFEGDFSTLFPDVTAKGIITPQVSMGIHWRRFSGIGPHISLEIPYIGMNFCMSYLFYEPEGLDGKLFHWERTLFFFNIPWK